MIPPGYWHPCSDSGKTARPDETNALILLRHFCESKIATASDGIHAALVMAEAIASKDDSQKRR